MGDYLTFEIATLAPVTYHATEMETWGSGGWSKWPDEYPFEQPVEGRHERSATPYPLSSSYQGADYIRTHPADSFAYPEWTSLRLTSPRGRAWGAFIEHIPWCGGYKGGCIGSPQLIWAEGAGAFWNQYRPGGDIPPDTRPIADVWGTDGSVSFTFSEVNDQDVTWSASDSTITVISDMEDRADEGVITTDTDLVLTRRIKIEQDGLRITSRLDYAGGTTDSVTALWEQLPLHVGRSSQSVSAELYSWTDGALELKMPGEVFEADTLAYVRDFGASGRDTVAIYLDELRSLTYQAHLSYPKNANDNPNSWDETGYIGRNLLVDLHPTGDGALQPIPASDSLVYKVSVDVPVFTPTRAVAAKLYPESTDTLPEGGTLHGQFNINWGPVADSAAYFEVMSDGVTWDSVGTLAFEGGNTYEHVGGAIPAGLDSVRVRMVGADASETVSAWTAKSAPTSTLISDTFTAADSTTLNNHMPDQSGSDSTYEFARHSMHILANEARERTGDGWASQVRIQTDAADFIARADVYPDGQSLEREAGLMVRDDSYFQALYAVVGTNGFELRDLSGGGQAAWSTALSGGVWYRIDLQVIGKVAVASLYDATDAHLRDLVLFGVDPAAAVAGFGVDEPGQRLDDFEVLTW